MQAYKNLSGRSNIILFDVGNDYIEVEFSDGAAYLYNYESAGVQNIEEMKKIAIYGEGLNSYITKYVRKKYASKLR